MRLLHLSTGILAHSSLASCSSCLRFEGCLLQMACFSSFHRCSIRFRSGLIEGHFRVVQCLAISHSWVFLVVCFGSLSCWRTHDLRLSPSFLTQQHISLQNALIVLRFHCTLHRFTTPCARCSKAAPEHN